MNNEFLEKVKVLLQSERAEILSKVKDEEIDSEGDETDEIQAKILLNIVGKLTIRNQSKLSQIAVALNRIEDKSYGLCEDCGDNISEKRLLVNPYCATCISCAEQREMDLKGK